MLASFVTFKGEEEEIVTNVTFRIFIKYLQIDKFHAFCDILTSHQSSL